MLDDILKTARTFESTHGTAPDIIYINPCHYERLCNQATSILSCFPGSRMSASVSDS